MNGLTVKASPGRPGIVDGVRFQNVQLNNVDNPITLTTHYFCDESHTSACYKNDGTAIKFKNINISGITGYDNDVLQHDCWLLFKNTLFFCSTTSWKDLPIININCAKNTPCENVNIKNVKIQGNKTTKKNVCINIIGADKIPSCRA